MDERTKAAVCALLDIMNEGVAPRHERSGDDIYFILNDNNAFRRTLILRGAGKFPCDDLTVFENVNYTFDSVTGIHSITGMTMDTAEYHHVEDVTRCTFEMTFSEAETVFNVYNASLCPGFWDNPWEYLFEIAYSITKKAEVCRELYCPAELELLPLLDELTSLGSFAAIMQRDKDGNVVSKASFPRLRELTSKYRGKKADKFFDRLEMPLDINTYYSVAEKLRTYLSLMRFEPLWREIYDAICESQKNYPKKDSGFVSEKRKKLVRDAIEEELHSHGYEGTYPDFVKTAPMRGLHLEESYGMLYLVGMKRHAIYRIRCDEDECDDGTLCLSFLTGTVLLRRGEACSDIYSCAFNAGGRRVFHTVNFDVPKRGHGMLKTYTDIAVKKAELRPLDKEEKRVYYGEPVCNSSLFLFVFVFMFLICGGFFGISFTAVFGIFASVMMMFEDGASFLPALAEFPWLFCFLFSWIGFGGAISVITLITKRK